MLTPSFLDKARTAADKVTLIVAEYYHTFGTPIPQGALARLSSIHVLPTGIRFPDFCGFLARHGYLVLLMNRRGQRALLPRVIWDGLDADRMRVISKDWRLADAGLYSRPTDLDTASSSSPAPISSTDLDKY